MRNLINLYWYIKKETISKRESGKSVGDLSAEYGMAKSAITTIKKKNKEEMKSPQVAKGISRLNSSHCNITEQMETLLLVWINWKQMAGDSVSAAIICEKAKQLFEDEDEGEEKSHSIPAEDLNPLAPEFPFKF